MTLARSAFLATKAALSSGVKCSASSGSMVVASSWMAARKSRSFPATIAMKSLKISALRWAGGSSTWVAWNTDLDMGVVVLAQHVLATTRMELFQDALIAGVRMCKARTPDVITSDVTITETAGPAPGCFC